VIDLDATFGKTFDDPNAANAAGSVPPPKPGAEEEEDEEEEEPETAEADEEDGEEGETKSDDDDDDQGLREAARAAIRPHERRDQRKGDILAQAGTQLSEFALNHG